MPRTFLDDRAAWFPEGALAEMPDFAADPERWRVIGWELEPGDAVFFDSYAPHRSQPNRTDQARRVLYITYNTRSEGDSREQYYADKRKNYPPDIERNPDKNYAFKV